MTRSNRTELALAEIFDWVAARGVQAGDLAGLELFAGDGRRQVQHYIDRLASLELWEVDEDLSARLRNNFPAARVRQTDSIVSIASGEGLDRYDFVAVDNPLGTYGPDDRYCEHFDVVPTVHRLLRSPAVVLLNLVPRPYGASKQPRWMTRRSTYYGVDDVVDLDVDFLLTHYETRFEEVGWSTRDSTATCREYDAGRDYFWYAGFLLERSASNGNNARARE